MHPADIIAMLKRDVIPQLPQSKTKVGVQGWLGMGLGLGLDDTTNGVIDRVGVRVR